MEYRYIGNSGLRVSPICMGTMSFGNWSDKEESFKILNQAYDRGINFYDTAEIYPVPPTLELAGVTEYIFGEWIKTKSRDSLIIATKVAGAASGWFVPPIRHGLTAIDRHHVEMAVEGSLRRLGIDYIDLYQVHWPDTVIPIDESMEALDRLVQTGKVRYLGTSNENAYGLTKANTIADYEGLTRFQSIQNNFSLLNRRFMDELANVCTLENVSLLPYSPIAGGVLSGKYNQAEIPENCRFGDYLAGRDPRQQAMATRFVNEATLASTAQYLEIARDLSMSPVTLATAWSMNFDYVASTMIGARTADQLEESLAALEVSLSDELMQRCDEVHKQHPYPMG
ncbi:MAG TPA: aldo/keto reductase [Gammaproteobacteria bacterium]|jgi:aryl-alcohol dehydrogenase-like predicted oxidoreductase|nr:aldo/keto reductase [Gammaproteobacteria bacterium]HIF87076.1 aldo/keto reductase [Gammaproteobacteria bacterium]HIL64058.1 aldo/keto reductase [Porticoccaceae bacterium]HIN89623.1 aldo/keto reductase [Porticoccaceae bacterium]|tara:strand:+ start:4202 stop:5221 length:1020 start_codon:yes stop_codon:yes gene_type:complete